MHRLVCHATHKIIFKDKSNFQERLNHVTGTYMHGINEYRVLMHMVFM